MKKNYDAIIIGAGIIGSAISFELSKKGWKTLNIDKNPSAGYGSTSTSCAIIRVYYSTFEGCAMAYEGYHYWKDWENYLSEINYYLDGMGQFSLFLIYMVTFYKYYNP